jgi:hypothetical protein
MLYRPPGRGMHGHAPRACSLCSMWQWLADGDSVGAAHGLGHSRLRRLAGDSPSRDEAVSFAPAGELPGAGWWREWKRLTLRSVTGRSEGSGLFGTAHMASTGCPLWLHGLGWLSTCCGGRLR